MTAPECIGKLILEKGYRVIAEIGINVCSFCDQLRGYLRQKHFGDGPVIPNDFPLDEYWMIDPWPYGYKCGSCGGEKMTGDRWDHYYREACRRMVGDKSLKVLRLTSLAACNLFPDNYFDLVYIDADHTYESVTDDIFAWLPKVKGRGAITGHDYGGGWQPVVNAVNDFFIKRSGKEGLKMFFEVDDNHYRMEQGVWVVELNEKEETS